jgi:hypothetical protein
MEGVKIGNKISTKNQIIVAFTIGQFFVKNVSNISCTCVGSLGCDHKHLKLDDYGSSTTNWSVSIRCPRTIASIPHCRWHFCKFCNCKLLLRLERRRKHFKATLIPCLSIQLSSFETDLFY